MPRRRSPRASRAARRAAAIRVMNAIRPVESAYVRALRGVMRAISRAYMKAVVPRLGEVARDDAKKTPEREAYEKAVAEARAARALNPLSNELDLVGVEVQVGIRHTVGPLFDRFSRELAKANAKGQAVFGITPRDTGMPGLLATARDENIALVERAHRVYAAGVRDVVSDPKNFGLRVEDLKAKLLERGDVSESRAELIARDQTLKLNGQIAATRQQAAGVDRYVWSTSLDDRVREEHAALEGQTFEWSSPPGPGHPGEDFQCRCVAIPVGVEELDEVFG